VTPDRIVHRVLQSVRAPDKPLASHVDVTNPA